MGRCHVVVKGSIESALDLKTKLHETGKRKRVSETGSETKRDLPKFWKRGNANIYIYRKYLNIYGVCVCVCVCVQS